MQRTLQPELLDSLPPDHPDALHSRRDLRLTNAILGNHRWFARSLPGLLQPDDVVMELGAGTGELGSRLRKSGVAVDGIDFWARPSSWPADRHWHSTDILGFPGYAAYPVVIANLILHQFSDDELRSLGARLRQAARVIVAAEPVRSRVSQVLFRIVAPLLGANHVSLHDAHVSIAAGFRDDELPRL
ncbi:MAG: hypothetical protein WD941_01065, partial [Opitutus sp.]